MARGDVKGRPLQPARRRCHGAVGPAAALGAGLPAPPSPRLNSQLNAVEKRAHICTARAVPVVGAWSLVHAASTCHAPQRLSVGARREESAAAAVAGAAAGRMRRGGAVGLCVVCRAVCSRAAARCGGCDCRAVHVCRARLFCAVGGGCAAARRRGCSIVVGCAAARRRCGCSVVVGCATARCRRGGVVVVVVCCGCVLWRRRRLGAGGGNGVLDEAEQQEAQDV